MSCLTAVFDCRLSENTVDQHQQVTAVQIITDCGNSTLDLKQREFCVPPLFSPDSGSLIYQILDTLSLIVYFITTECTKELYTDSLKKCKLNKLAIKDKGSKQQNVDTVDYLQHVGEKRRLA